MKHSTRTIVPAYLIAGTALFISLGGPSYAASLVTGSNIKDGTVTGADIKNSSLTGTDVKDSSLTGADTKDGSLTGADLKDGSLTGADAADNTLTGSDVKDGSLEAKDLATSVQSGLTTSACPAGTTLTWVSVPVERVDNGNPVASNAYVIGRCYSPGSSVIGDGKLEAPEECDDGNAVSGDGCDNTGHWDTAVQLRTKLH